MWSASKPSSKARQSLLRALRLLLASAVLVSLALPAMPCSTFRLERDGATLVAKNYDWSIGNGLLVVNPRGLSKTSVPPVGERPLSWTARYGSVTFNQYGREFPAGGMNESGLVVELMWLDGSRYPAPDERPALSVLQWIQYQLDTAGSVAEVLASERTVRIESRYPQHFLMADPSGQVATLEFLAGRPVIHQGTKLPVAVLTNSTYDSSLDYWQRLQAKDKRPRGSGSQQRFARAADHLNSLPATAEPVNWAFDGLKSISQPTTQWSIVYELDPKVLHFRTRRHRERRQLTLDQIDFSCARSSHILDLEAPVEGDLTPHLEPYSVAANFEMVRRSYRRTDFLSGATRQQLQELARYPDRATCSAP